MAGLKRSVKLLVAYGLGLIFVACILVLVVASAFDVKTLGGPYSAFASPSATQPPVFRLHFHDLSELREALRLVENVDVFGVDLSERLAIVSMSHDDADALRRLGYRIEEDLRLSSLLPDAWSGDYYTYDRMAADLADLVDRFPNLVSLHDLGPTWRTTKGLGNRRIWALRVSSSPVGKPQVLFVAGEHAREIATVEVAMRLAKHLLENYGTDPEATFLVDNRDVWIAPMVNPDGHVLVEQGMIWKRKNGNTDNGSCGEPNWGVDLNRNFSYQWGLYPGSSADPCEEAYHGPSAASEPETQAITNVINANSFALLMDYHSYSNLILWPWGYQYDDTGVDPRLPAIGNKLSQVIARNTSTTYWPEQGSSLYPTSGNLLDWAYATRSVLAFTTEIGSYLDGFDPPYTRIDAFWAENGPPALYLINIADDTNRVNGPEARGATVSASSIDPTGALTLTATFSDSGNGDQIVDAAEFFVDSPGADGTGTAMDPVDGAFDSPTEVVRAIVPASSIGPGRHILLVRGRDTAGNWGSLGMVFARVDQPYKLYLPLVAKEFSGGW